MFTLQENWKMPVKMCECLWYEYVVSMEDMRMKSANSHISFVFSWSTYHIQVMGKEAIAQTQRQASNCSMRTGNNISHLRLTWTLSFDLICFEWVEARKYNQTEWWKVCVHLVFGLSVSFYAKGNYLVMLKWNILAIINQFQNRNTVIVEKDGEHADISVVLYAYCWSILVLY